MSMRMSTSRSASAGNASRDAKWAQAIANKKSLADAATTSANARAADVAQQQRLTAMRQSGATQRTGMANRTQLANTKLMGQNTLANTKLMGQNTLANTTLQGQNDIGLAEYDAKKRKEQDIRGLGIDAMKNGQNGPEVENLVNTDGNNNAYGLGNVNFQQTGQRPFANKFIPGEMGSPDRVYDPNTNEVQIVGGATQPAQGPEDYGSQMIKGQDGSNIMTNDEFNNEAAYVNATQSLGYFDPKNVSNEQRSYLEELNRKNPDVFKRIMSKYRSGR